MKNAYYTNAINNNIICKRIILNSKSFFLKK